MVSRGSPAWWVFHDRSLLGRYFPGFVLPILEYCPAVSIHTLTTWPCRKGCPFYNWRCVWVWHCSSSICGSTVHATCTRSGETRFTLSMQLYMCRMCQFGLLAVLWSQIGILMRILAAEPLSTTGPLFFSQCPCRSILLIFDGVWLASFKSRANAFYCHKLLDLLLSSTVEHFLFFLSTGWYCKAGVFWVMGCKSLSPSLVLLIMIYNNNEWTKIRDVYFYNFDYILMFVTSILALVHKINYILKWKIIYFVS